MGCGKLYENYISGSVTPEVIGHATLLLFGNQFGSCGVVAVKHLQKNKINFLICTLTYRKSSVIIEFLSHKQ